MLIETTAPPAGTREMQGLYRLAQACNACRNESDFALIARTSARELLPHTALIAALGRVDLEHLEILHLTAVDYPAAGVAALSRVSNVRERPALMHWLRSREPMVLEPGDNTGLMSELERHEIASLGLGRVAAHGVIDIASRSGSYHSFAGIPSCLPRQAVEERLRLIVPHLHQALVASRSGVKQTPKRNALLTPTERELLRFVAAGRTNAEIAAARGRSAATIRNQLTEAFRKLGVRNRAEAVRAELLLDS